jgi:hypothetical protein
MPWAIHQPSDAPIPTGFSAPGGSEDQRIYHPATTLRDIMNSNCRSTAIRAAQDLVIDDDLVLGFLQFEA